MRRLSGVPSQYPGSRSWRLPLLPLVLVCAIAHALFYVVTIPPWDLFDEEQHLAYVIALRDERSIPHLDDPIPEEILASAAATDRWQAFRLGRPEIIDVDAIGLEGRSYEAYQPPLAYVLLAPATALAGGDVLQALYLARLVCVLSFAALVTLTWIMARAWFPTLGEHGAASAALTLAAIPAAAQAAGRVSNDLLAALLLAAGVSVATRMYVKPTLQSASLVGLLAAAAVLTKAHGALLLPLVVILLAILWRQRRLTTPVAAAALVPGVVALFAWTAWTYASYGVVDGSRAYLDRYQTYEPLSFENFLRTFWLNSWSDYWGAYRGDIGGGWLLVLTNVTLLLLAGAAVGHAVRHQPRHSGLLLTGLLAVLFLVALAVANHTAIVRPGGRLLLPLYPALAVLIANSWRHSRTAIQYVPAIAIWSLSLAYAGWWFLPFFYR